MFMRLFIYPCCSFILFILIYFYSILKYFTVKMAPGVEAVVVAECLKRTLEPNAQIRRIAENDLKQMEQLPGKLLIYVRIDNMGIAIDNFT